MVDTPQWPDDVYTKVGDLLNTGSDLDGSAAQELWRIYDAERIRRSACLAKYPNRNLRCELSRGHRADEHQASHRGKVYLWPGNCTEEHWSESGQRVLRLAKDFVENNDGYLSLTPEDRARVLKLEEAVQRWSR